MTERSQRARLILYVGKGGVGKTTVAAATAVMAAALGYRTLVVSTDIAHSLGDVLEERLTGVPKLVADNLWAQEISVLEQARQTLDTVQDRLAEVLKKEGIPAIQAEELAVVPGMQELASLVEIGQACSSGAYDVLIVDAAPTGETLRLLTIPDSFQWYAGRLQGWRQRLNRFAKPLIKAALPSFEVVDVLEDLSARVKELRSTLEDPLHTSYRIVVTPERAVLKEALRAETYLNLFEYPLDAVVLNRVMPAGEKGDAYVEALRSRQAKMVAEVRAAFTDLPILTASLTAEEPAGLSALADLARQIFAGRDPIEIMHVGPRQRFEQTEDGYVLMIHMPNVEHERLSLMKVGDELYVDLGNFRREITLPTLLATLEAGRARIRSGTLEVPFTRRALD